MSEEVGIVEELKESYEKLGPLRKVVKTQFGIVSGHTRKKAVPEWPETYKEVKDYYEHLKIMAADNIHELKKPEWWTSVLSEAAKELEKQGVEKGKIAAKLEQDFPLSERSIYRYLPQEFKQPKGPRKFIATVAIKKPKPREEKPVREGVEVKEAVSDYEPWYVMRERGKGPVGKMENRIAERLNQAGVRYTSQEPIGIISDFNIPGKDLVIFLDGPPHRGHEEEDEVRDEFVRRYLGKDVLAIPYDKETKEEEEWIWNQIEEAIR